MVDLLNDAIVRVALAEAAVTLSAALVVIGLLGMAWTAWEDRRDTRRDQQ
jgi:hypothetical protein